MPRKLVETPKYQYVQIAFVVKIAKIVRPLLAALSVNGLIGYIRTEVGCTVVGMIFKMPV